MKVIQVYIAYSHAIFFAHAQNKSIMHDIVEVREGCNIFVKSDTPTAGAHNNITPFSTYAKADILANFSSHTDPAICRIDKTGRLAHRYYCCLLQGTR